MPTWTSVPLSFERYSTTSQVFVRSKKTFSAMSLGKHSVPSNPARQDFFLCQLRRLRVVLSSETIPIFIAFRGERYRMDMGCIGHAFAAEVIQRPVDGPLGYMEEVILA
jgi:hypothetical protein